MKTYFAYIRVSTIRQGEHGSSLHEQRDAIQSFAVRHDLAIVAWFEERETAAKVGRSEFTRMLAALKKGKASGVIFHKIDRSARNLKDWSAVQDLADQGIDVRFTQESVNLGSNEGKLTGDFLAVISSHYIRNLREEVRKGIRGRLKQGIYPRPAPIGYLDQGGGKPKTLDPVRAPLIREAFELYASSRYPLRALSDELYRRGLRNKPGKQVGVNRLSEILKNPFYVGIIRLRRSGESFPGVHESLISKSLFDQVQSVLAGKATIQWRSHDFLFRRMIRCAHCGYSLIGELQKGRVYYRCQTSTCPTLSIREDAVHASIAPFLTKLTLSREESEELAARMRSFVGDRQSRREDRLRSINLHMDQLNARVSRLIDAYLDSAVDRPLFEERKFALLMERKALEESRACIGAGIDAVEKDLADYLELLKDLSLSYETANAQEKRQLLKTITSNLVADGKKLVVELHSPFLDMRKLPSVLSGSPVRDRPRTALADIMSLLVKHCLKDAGEDGTDTSLPRAA
jgi:DNA invertase Pin-like site-specific DNA recombinase